MRVLVLFLLLNSISGCYFVTDQFIDCLDDDRPEITTDQLPQAVLNQEYEAVIFAKLENRPDSNFRCYFSTTDSLPEGLQFFRYGLEPELRIEGAPTEHGVFEIELKLSIETHASDQQPPEEIEDDEVLFPGSPDSELDEDELHFEDGDDLCSDHDRKELRLVVNIN